MDEQKDTPRSILLADVAVGLRIPVETVAQLLKGTEWEGTSLDDVSDMDRERVGELLDELVSDNFGELLAFSTGDVEARVDW